MSQDLKFRRELRKALTELKQKEEDYRYAIEIGESLTKENEYLKRQLDEVETQLAAQENDNDLLKKKLETLSMTYRSDLYKYHQDLQAHKELVTELTKDINEKEKELNQQQIETQHKYRYGGPGAAKMNDILGTLYHIILSMSYPIGKWLHSVHFKKVTTPVTFQWEIVNIGSLPILKYTLF